MTQTSHLVISNMRQVSTIFIFLQCGFILQDIMLNFLRIYKCVTKKVVQYYNHSHHYYYYRK